MHLSLNQINRYRQSQLVPNELLDVDDHIGTCDFCRHQLFAGLNLESALNTIKNNITMFEHEEHLALVRMASLVNNSLDPVERELAYSHLEFCAECNEQVQSLKLSALEAGGGSTVMTMLDFLRDRFALLWPMPVAAALTLMLVSFADWMYVASRPSVAAMVRQEPVPHQNEVTVAQLNEPALVVTKNVPPIRLNSKPLVFPADLTTLRSTASTKRGIQKQQPTFGLLSPIQTFVLSTRPTFRWQAQSNATSYVIKIFTEDYELIATSPILKTNAWAPSTPLERGKTYLWQASALVDGVEMLGKPKSGQAKFKLLDEQTAKKVGQAKRSVGSALELGRVYAEAGLLDKTIATLRAIRKSNAEFPMAQKLLRQTLAQQRK